MAKVILICGRICSGKTTYAKRLCRETSAVLLSVDELMLTMFGMYAGENHDLYAARSRSFLLEKTVDLIRSGVDVILDWGFWTKSGRDEMRAYCVEHNLPYEFHFLDVEDTVWQARIAKRNAAVESGEVNAYYIDENLANKFHSRFELPQKEEIDFWLTNI